MQEFLNRVGKNWKIRQKWASRAALEVFRVYDRDVPQSPFVIDKVGQWFVVGSFAKFPGENDQLVESLPHLGRR